LEVSVYWLQDDDLDITLYLFAVFTSRLVKGSASHKLWLTSIDILVESMMLQRNKKELAARIFKLRRSPFF